MSLSNEEKEELFEEFKNRLHNEKVYVELLDEELTLPFYAHEGDAGMDVRASKDVIINPGETKIIPTGLKVAIASFLELQARPRSGLSLKTPLRIANAPGTIDSGYKDEVGIIITNTSKEVSNPDTYLISEVGNKPGIYKICKGDRIAQLVLTSYVKASFVLVPKDTIASIGNDRGGGYGTSGLK